MITAILIEDDEMGIIRAINAARTQNLIPELTYYNRNDVEFIWVKNFNEFTQYIVKNGLPDALCFDHDLGGNSYQLYHKHKGYKSDKINYDEYDEPTGYHCAKWLTEYCMDNKLSLTSDIFCHSMNPQGRENIKAMLKNILM